MSIEMYVRGRDLILHDDVGDDGILEPEVAVGSRDKNKDEEHKPATSKDFSFRQRYDRSCR